MESGNDKEQWFPGSHDRIRWWVKEGQCAAVAPMDMEDCNVPWGVLPAVVGRLSTEDSQRVYAEWIVCRPDLGLAVTASKLEVALDAYYSGLASKRLDDGRTVGEALGADGTRILTGKFSSREPEFYILSGMDRAPVVTDLAPEAASMADGCDNVLPMKKAAFAKTCRRA